MSETKNVYQRIHAVMQEVEYLSKDDKVSTGGDNYYKAISEEKVTVTVRAAMIKHGLVIIPVKQESVRTDETIKSWDKYAKCEVDKVNRISNVNTEYRIQNIDDVSDYVIAASSGTGVDTQDKGVGKAMTYAFKYLLLRTFAIPTGEDPDKISSDDYTRRLRGELPPEEPPAEEPQAEQSYSEETQYDRLNSLRRAIKKLVPNDELREVTCKRKYGKSFLSLSEIELQAIYANLNAKRKKEAAPNEEIPDVYIDSKRG